MDFRLFSRVALVTGASTGIGRETALALAREGATVVIAARRPEPLERTRRDIATLNGGRAHAFTADLSRSHDREALVERTRQAVGDPDVVVLNTGGPPSGPALSLSAGQWEEGWHLLLESAVHMTRLVAPAMMERRWGRILAVTSLAVKEPIPDIAISNAFRAGLTALFKTLSRELGGHGITVNSVAPGWTSTERMEELLNARAEREGVSSEAIRERVLAAVPSGRAGRPEEVAAVLAFLASEAASYVNGVVIPVDGGATKSLL